MINRDNEKDGKDFRSKDMNYEKRENFKIKNENYSKIQETNIKKVKTKDRNITTFFWVKIEI